MKVKVKLVEEGKGDKDFRDCLEPGRCLVFIRIEK